MLCKTTLNDCVPAYSMAKWEYLVVKPIYGYLKPRDERSTPVQTGFSMNEKEIPFKTIMYGRQERIDSDNCENFRRWESVGNYQLLNELGDEGWELIKIRGKNSSFYFFKRPL